MGLNWRESDNYWYAYGAEEDDPRRSVWRVVPTGDAFDLWVESGITKEQAKRIASYPSLDEGMRAGDAFHATGEL